MKNCAPTTKAVITTKTSDSEVLIFCVEFWEMSHLTRDLSQAERENNVVTSWANATLTSISLKIFKVVILSENYCHFVSCSAWDKSHVKWDNSWNSAQKMKTWDSCNLDQRNKYCNSYEWYDCRYGDEFRNLRMIPFKFCSHIWLMQIFGSNKANNPKCRNSQEYQNVLPIWTIPFLENSFQAF